MVNNSPINIFGLVRHAPTVWNRENRIQGRDDTPLTSEGERQAREWGRRLKAFRWDRIMASSAGRALKTAELINISLKIPMAEHPMLQEQDWGEWTGKTVTQIERDTCYPLSEQASTGWGFCPPGGEDRNRVWERSQSVLKKATEKWPGKNILVVTHEGVIKCLLYRLSGQQFLPTESPMLLKNHLHLLIDDRQKLRIKKINAFSLS